MHGVIRFEHSANDSTLDFTCVCICIWRLHVRKHYFHGILVHKKVSLKILSLPLNYVMHTQAHSSITDANDRNSFSSFKFYAPYFACMQLVCN